MGASNSKEPGGGGGGAGRRSIDIRPGGLSGLTQLPGPLSLKEYKSRLATSEGAQTLYFSQSGLKVKYAFASLRGLYPNAHDKPNQDSLCVHTHYGGDPEQAFFGIYDGHGEFGTECSQFAKDKLPENLLNSPHLMVQPEKAFRQAMVLTNKQLHRQPKDEVDDSMSGTTAISLLLRNRMVYVANVGDSRAVMAEWQGKQLVAQDLSFDQTPFRRDECERVKKCGARVLTLDQLEGSKDPNIEYWGTEEDNDGDPPRLWAANASYPGTAFTRSIGDKVAEGIGVTAEPEVLAMELTPSHPFMVLASDGVWEFMPSQEVVNMVSRFDDPQEACILVVTEAYRLWLEHETRTDDISMIVVQFSAFQPDTSSMMDPALDPSLITFSASTAASAAGMSASYSTEASAGSWYGGLPPHLQPQLSSLSSSAANLSPAYNATLAAAAVGRLSFSAGPHPNGGVPTAVLAPTPSFSGFPAVQPPPLPAPAMNGQSATAMLLSESVALRRKLELEVEHQQQLRASKQGAGSPKQCTPVVSLHASSAGDPASSDAPERHQPPTSMESNGAGVDGFSLEDATASSFLFRRLNSQEKSRVLQAFQQVPIKAGQLVIRQGGPGDHFYVIQAGILDVYLQQDPAQAPLLVHSYEALPAGAHAGPAQGGRFAYFGELALMYRRPRVATVVARTDGVLWSLHRNDFKACLQHSTDAADGRDTAALVRTLQQVEVLGCLNGTQLRALAEAMEEATFEDGQLIIQQGQEGQHFFVVQCGQVVCSARKNRHNVHEQPKEVLRLGAGQYFGERALLASSSTRAASAHAHGRVVLHTIGRQELERVLGATLQAFIDAHAAWRAQLVVHQQLLAQECVHVHPPACAEGLVMDDLVAQGLLCSTDCSALMLMEHRQTEEIFTVRLTSVADVVSLGKQALLLRARTLTRALQPSFFIPSVLKSFKDCRVMSEVLSSVGLCTLDMLLAGGPLDELSAMFVVASVLLGLEHLHHSHIIYRGLSPHSIIVTEAGHLQLMDFQFARVDNDGRACTLCGDPEYLAPEMVESRNHTTAVDLWALGVLIFSLLSGSTPFSAPGDDELHIYRKLCARVISWPPYMSPTARGLVDNLLQLQPQDRLGTGPGGLDALKHHPWFAPMDWDALVQLRLPPPPGMLQRIDAFEGVACARFDPPPYMGDLSWLDNF